MLSRQSSFKQERENRIPTHIHNMIAEFSWVITMVTGNAQHCHRTVTFPDTLATVKTIVIAGYLT